MRERADIQVDLAGRVEKRVLSWLGHLERMSEQRITKRVWRALVPGRRCKGRPRFRWIDSAKRALEGLSVEEAKGRTGDQAE